MLSWPTAATSAGARGLDERVSTRLFGTYMSCTHPRHLTSGCSLFDIVTKRRTSKEAQSKNEKLKYVVNSNLASKPRNSLFWSSLGVPHQKTPKDDEFD